MSHCITCTTVADFPLLAGYDPDPEGMWRQRIECPGCGHEARIADLEAALEAWTPHGMQDVRASWATGEVCDACSHTLCIRVRALEAEVARLTLAQARDAQP